MARAYSQDLRDRVIDAALARLGTGNARRPCPIRIRRRKDRARLQCALPPGSLR